jgi:hypothetical protein
MSNIKRSQSKTKFSQVIYGCRKKSNEKVGKTEYGGGHHSTSFTYASSKIRLRPVTWLFNVPSSKFRAAFMFYLVIFDWLSPSKASRTGDESTLIFGLYGARIVNRLLPGILM